MAIFSAIGSVLGAREQRGAARDAATAQTNVATQNNALALDFYNRNTTNFTPQMQRGEQAGALINSLIGLGGQPAQTQAFDTFRNSTGYQFQRDQGLSALDASAASRGALRSGAAQQSAQRFGDNLANQSFYNWAGLVADQRNIGASAASALAGVGNTYVSNVSANNQNAADAISNSALIRGNANQQMYAGVGNALANSASRVASSFMGGIR